VTELEVIEEIEVYIYEKENKKNKGQKR